MQLKFKPLISGRSPSETKVVVAMSGGVDSSFVASMLHILGYDVVGVTMQLYKPNSPAYGSCCTGVDVEDARCVSSSIGFPHYVLNYEEVFKNEVIDYFLESYRNGETPVPCIKCNQKVKFCDLLEFTKDIGAAVLVTGHYARVEVLNDELALLKAVDPSKDQSYFLFTMTNEQLAHIRFPLGDFSKEEVRVAAKEMGLHVATKPDSQDICFVQDRYTELFKFSKADAGNIIYVDGSVIGRHSGIEAFTVGQRRGLGVSWHEPLYVLQINKSSNDIIVGPESMLLKSKVCIRGISWVSRVPLETGSTVTAKLRASHVGAAAVFNQLNDGVAEVVFIEPQKAVAPGQACVLYDGDVLLGGGWIFDR